MLNSVLLMSLIKYSIVTLSLEFEILPKYLTFL